MSRPVRSRFAASALAGVLLVPLLTPVGRTQDLWSLYGGGCPTSEGARPILRPSSQPFIGNPAFGVSATALPPAAMVSLLVSVFPADLPIGGSGCRLLVGPSPIFFFPMVRTSPQDAELSFPLPNLPQFLGASFYAQLGVIEASGFSTSPGLRVTLGEADHATGSLSVLIGAPSALQAEYHDPGGSHIEGDLPSSMSLSAFQIHPSSLPGPFIDDQTGERPQEDLWNYSFAPSVELGEVGRLYSFFDNTAGQGGVFVALADGAGFIPLLSPALGNGGSFGNQIAVSEDGSRVALSASTGANGTPIWLAATDGLPLQGTARAVEVSPAGRVLLQGPLYIVGETLFFRGQDLDQGGSDAYYIAPTDGSAPAVALALPPLASGSPPSFFNDGFVLQAEGRLAWIAGVVAEGTTDLYVFDDETQAATNITLFPAGQSVTSLSGGTYATAALSRDGSQIAFVSLGELYVASTDGTDAGQLIGAELSHDTVFGSSLQSFAMPSFDSGFGLLVFAGSSSFQMDLYHLELDSHKGEVQAAENITQTSGQSAPPFTTTGNIRPLHAGPNSDEAYIFQRGSSGGIWDLVAVELVDLIPVSLTGNEFTPSALPSYSFIRWMSWARDRRHLDVVREPTLFELRLAGGTVVLGSFDRLDPLAGSSSIQTWPSGTSVDGVEFRSDGGQVCWTTGASGSSTLWSMNLPSSAPAPVRVFSGEVADGSLRYVHATDPTVAYVVGSNDAIQPSDAQIVHTSIRTGLSTIVPTPLAQIVMGNVSDEGPRTACQFTAEVKTQCLCVGDDDGKLIVTITAKNPDNSPIEVRIEGNGPTFEDGTRMRTIPCKKDTHTFPIKANQTPGCFNLTVGGITFEKRIRVVKITPEFRNTGTFSPDNMSALKQRFLRSDPNLGVGTNPFGPKSKHNTMEIRFALEPKDGCDCKFDIKRTLHRKSYKNGVPGDTKAPGTKDDETNTDEDRKPSAAGNIYSLDTPGPGSSDTDMNGDVREYRAHFIEWVRISPKRRDCLPGFNWESHLYVTRQNGAWVVDPAKSDISAGHDIPLDSQHQ